jgi:putative ABC transport system substrate-binding protein
MIGSVARRSLISAGASGSLAAIFRLSTQSASAQPAGGRVRRVGFLWIGSADVPSGFVDAFRGGLRDAGWIDGQNAIIEYRYAEGKPERFAALAAELVGMPVDVIVAGPAPAASASRNATRTIPIVITLGADPVAMGLVASLDQPGGNVTGLYENSPEHTPRRLALLKELVPNLRRAALLWQPGTLREDTLKQTKDEAVAWGRATGVDVELFEARAPAELEATFDAIGQKGVNGLVVLVSPMFNTEAKRITGLAERHRIPTVYEWRTFVAAGGAVSYGADLEDIYRRAAGYVDKILKGASPAGLSVQGPTKLELVVNLKNAARLGLTIPEDVLRRADQVIR